MSWGLKKPKNSHTSTLPTLTWAFQSPTSKVGCQLIRLGDMCFDVKDDGGLQRIIQDNEQMQMTPRSVTFEISCGRDEEDFKVIDSSKCNIRLGIQHSLGCRSGSSAGSGVYYARDQRVWPIALFVSRVYTLFGRRLSL